MKPSKIKTVRTDKLVLRRETVVVLTLRQLADVAGGSIGCNVSRDRCVAEADGG
jgi:hypothetical protein